MQDAAVATNKLLWISKIPSYQSGPITFRKTHLEYSQTQLKNVLLHHKKKKKTVNSPLQDQIKILESFLYDAIKSLSRPLYIPIQTTQTALQPNKQAEQHALRQKNSQKHTIWKSRKVMRR